MLKAERVTENWTMYCKMLSSEMSICFDCNTQQSSNVRTRTALQCDCHCSASHLAALQTRYFSYKCEQHGGRQGQDEKRQFSNFWGSGIRHHSAIAEQTSLLGRYAVSLDKWLPTLWKHRSAVISRVPAAFLGCMTLKMMALWSFEMVQSTHPTKQHHVQGDLSLQLLGKLMSGKRGISQTSHINRVSHQYKNTSESIIISLSVLSPPHFFMPSILLYKQLCFWGAFCNNTPVIRHESVWRCVL
jgi:hypothetical protein